MKIEMEIEIEDFDNLRKLQREFFTQNRRMTRNPIYLVQSRVELPCAEDRGSQAGYWIIDDEEDEKDAGRKEGPWRPEPAVHQILQEPVLLEERIAYIESRLESGAVLEFEALLKPSQGRMGMVVTFMAILELTRQQKLTIVATGVEAPLAVQGARA